MDIPTLDGITAERINTTRITTRVLFSGKAEGIPILFLHGNWSCATWWEETMLSLPEEFWGIAFDQRGYGQADFEKKVDATSGAGDFAEDAVALLDHLNIDQAHILGCSMGGYTVWQLMKDFPERFSSAVLVNPAPPYGFSGTKDIFGTPCFKDYSGTGGGLRNQELISRVVENDRSTDHESSPRMSLRALFQPEFKNPREEDLLSSVLATHIGNQDIPGDFTQSPNWPFLAPGKWGANNASSPKYAGEVSEIFDGRMTAPILWIRGELDFVISDSSNLDTGYLGKIGMIPDWPGETLFPPQPMLKQTRYVLEKYSEAGGDHYEEVIPNSGHVPFIDQPDDFNQGFHKFIRQCNG